MTFKKKTLKLFSLLLITAMMLTTMPAQPVYAASIVVNDAGDVVGNDSVCTLREAITNANNDAATYTDCAAGAGADTITFAGNYIITLVGSQLPVIWTEMTITGKGITNTIIQSNVAPNTATYRVFEVNASGDLRLNGLTVRNGRCDGSCPTSSTDGGGIYNTGNATLTDVTLSGNTVSGGGGGIYNQDGTLTLTDITFSNNSTSINGGGFEGGGGIVNGGNATLTNVTFSGNSAANSGGGGILNFDSLTVTNATFSGNSAGNDGGGGINNFDTLTVTNATFSGNSTTAARGGGILSTSGTLTLNNVIIANSNASLAPDCFGNANTTTSANNLFESAAACGLSNGSDGNIIGVDPILGPLADNGGSTHTHALLAGSSAIDNGANCPATDQRGVLRPQGAGCDIGAYELDDTAPTVTTTDLPPIVVPVIVLHQQAAIVK